MNFVTEQNLARLRQKANVAPGRIRLAEWIESWRMQMLITGVIVLNAIILGLETNASLMASAGGILEWIDGLCLAVFVVEIGVKLFAYRSLFVRSGWNIFDALVVGIALVPGAGPWSVLRSLRVLRILRLLTVVPALRKVVAAFLHSIPGLSGVVAVMSIFFYTSGVLATRLFGETHAEWFGTLARSLYSLFQIMTLESWSMGIVRPVMEQHPWAWAFFVPFIVIATFTILNLFIGIIVSTMQELAITPEPEAMSPEIRALLQRMDGDLKQLSLQIEKHLRRENTAPGHPPRL
jgi:voltage-gated sodium channel